MPPRVSAASRLRSLSWLAIAVVTFALTGEAADAGASPSVTVQHLTVDVDRGAVAMAGGRVDVETRFHVVNAGTAPVEPVVRILVESQIGGGVHSAPIALGTVGPGERVTVTRTIRSVLPFGSVRVVVSVRADGRTTTARASKAVVPWLLLLAVVVVVAVAIALRARRRHRRALGPPTSNPTDGAPGGPPF